MNLCFSQYFLESRRYCPGNVVGACSGMSKAKPTRRIRPGGNGRKRDDSLRRSGTPDLIAALCDDSPSHDFSAVQEMCERVALGIGCTLNHNRGNRNQAMHSTGLALTSASNIHSHKNQFDEVCGL